MNGIGTGTARANRSTLVRPLLPPQRHSSTTDFTSLYTIDNTTPATGIGVDSDDESVDDGVSYFGSAGQDYLLKKIRAKRSKIICWLDLLTLVIFTTFAVLRSPKIGDGDGIPDEGWTWELSSIPWLLTLTALARITFMFLTARYSDGNYNTALITLSMLFEINMAIQHRIALTTTIIAQYFVSMILTQIHWISYSVHTPMSASLAYAAYDPVFSEGITFSRESRYIGAYSNHRGPTLKRGTSYGTISSSPFDTVQETEEIEEEHDVFIKVDVERRKLNRQNFYMNGDDEQDVEEEDDGGGHDGDEGDENYDDEEQDMATLLAFQDARRQQVFAFSPTASSGIIPSRSILSPQAIANDSSNSRAPLSWAFPGQQNGSYNSSFDMRLAAAGPSGAAAVSGGLTVGYTPRKRTLQSNTRLSGTGRRTWTGGHNIIYSGIFVEDSDEDELDQGHGQEEDDSTLLRDDDENNNDDNSHDDQDSDHDDDDGKLKVQIDFDEAIKAEIIDISVVDSSVENRRSTVHDEDDQKVPQETIEVDSQDCSHTRLSGVEVEINDTVKRKQHPHFREPTDDETTEDMAIDMPGESDKVDHEGHQHHPHGLSTLKLHISSHKDVTAVMCDEDNCSEHQYQEGPAAELEAAIGPGFSNVNIVQLDIKENSRSSVEQTGEGINDFEESSRPSSICDLPGLSIGISNGQNGAKIGDIGPILNEDHRKSPGSHTPKQTESTDSEQMINGSNNGTSTTEVVVVPLPGALPAGNDRLDNIAISTEGQDHEEESRRRIHIHERREKITIEEDDEFIGGVGIHGETIHPSHIITTGGVAGGVAGGVVAIGGSTDSTDIITAVPGCFPGQHVDIQDGGQTTGIITWGVADDIPPYVQDSIYLETAPEPVVFIPPQRTSIVDPPQQRIIAVEPSPVVVQPQSPPMVIQRLPEPIVYSPPPRPVIIPPRFAPQPVPVMRPMPVPAVRPMPIVQPAPVFVAPPPPRTIIQPQPQPMLRPQPQIIAAAPQQIIAQAPVFQPPVYGTYETVVPGASMAGVGVGAPLARGNSIASIYSDDVRTIASIYDDRSIASVYEYEDGVGVASVGVGGRPGWMRGQPLPGIAYGRHEHVVSAAHIPRTREPYDLQNEIREAIDDPLNQHPEVNLFNSRAVAMNTGHFSHQRHSLSSIEDQSEISDLTSINHRDSSHTENDMEVETTLAFAAARHEVEPSDDFTEAPYLELNLQGNLPITPTIPIQGLALETYMDTTKSQFKVREQKGLLLSEMRQQLEKRQRQQTKIVRRENEGEVEERKHPHPLPASPLPTQVEELSIPFASSTSPSPRPTLNFPKPPQSPPPVRLLASRGLGSPLTKAKGIPIVSRSPTQNRNNERDPLQSAKDEGCHAESVILSNSALNTENIMLQARHQNMSKVEVIASTETVYKQDVMGTNARSLISESILASGTASNFGTTKSISIERTTLKAAHGKPPLPGTVTQKSRVGYSATPSRKTKRKLHIPPMSRHQLHPILLQEGIMACWNNEFGNALDTFKEHSTTYPRWSLASAEVHIVRQLISGQLSEADLDLMDSLQLAEKVGLRVFDKKQEFESNFMSYRSICSADATLATANDNTLRQNYKWDCDMAFYDTLLYRGILQFAAASDTKGFFPLPELKGGMQLRRAWKGYMRIKQEVEAAKEKWQKLSSLVAQSQPTALHQMDNDSNAHGGEEKKRERPASKSYHPSQQVNASSTPISIPAGIASTKKGPPLSSSQPTESGSRWSIFGKRSSWNHQSTGSLSSSPPVTEVVDIQDTGERSSWFLATSPTSKGFASALREQAKAVEEIKTAIKVLDDVEDYLNYGVGLLYFIVMIVPKALLPALRTIGFQSNHEQGIKNLEAVFTRKNGRAPFAALFLLINYLFLPRGMNDPAISLGRAGEIIEECLKTCPNGSSYLLMACHHARKTGNMIPAALNHITRGIQTCEAAVIPSINYRFELGLTFFIHQEYGKAADIFEILWKKYVTTAPAGVLAPIAGPARRRKGRSSSIDQSVKNEAISGHSTGSSVTNSLDEEEEDDFELAPFCGLCLIASKVVVRLGQEGYFEYGRDGFGRNNNHDNGPLSPISSLLQEGELGPRTFFGMSAQLGTPRSTSHSIPRPGPGPDFDLLVAAQEVLMMMSDSDGQAISTMKSMSGGSVYEHSKAGSAQSTDTSGGMSTTNSHLLSSPVPTQSGKLNRFNKFAWNQCQKSLQRGSISPFLPLVILYLRRDLAYMKPVLLRKLRTILETIWKSVQQTADADTQAIYLLLSAVVHRQLLPDDATFAYTALTDCLLLESSIENEMWVVPHCHYELGELLYKRLHLPHEALEQFQWIVKGPGKEVRPSSIFGITSAPPVTNPRLSVFGGGFPSDTVTNIIESVAAQNAATMEEDGHSKYPSSTSNHRLSQMFLSSSANGGASAILGSSPTHIPTTVTSPPNPMTFYNSRYKKFEFSQALRHRSSVSIEQIQNEINAGEGSTSVSRRASLSAAISRTGSTAENLPLSRQDISRKRSSVQSVDLTDQNKIGSSKSIKLSNGSNAPAKDETLQNEHAVDDGGSTSHANSLQAPRSQRDTTMQASFSQGWNTSSMPNILSDAQRKRGSQQLLKKK
ncbi:hypothetical protein BGZ76_005953 [Entomortierella beljakovae]|nr:hypothetical protein BGZ76_005953 [Entomortierella beljakovae]